MSRGFEGLGLSGSVGFCGVQGFRTWDFKGLWGFRA